MTIDSREHESLPPALLGDATWYGTLAAARDLGSRGVPVTLASDALLAPARWSRHVRATERCPPTKDAAAFLAWLQAFGDRHPGHVLYPTSDDAAWLIASNREALAARFRLYSPGPDTLAMLLDKARLATTAREVGLLAPDFWLPESDAEVERIAEEADFPLFVKPRTQVLARGGLKGSRVFRRDELVATWRASCLGDDQVRLLGAGMKGARYPLVQVCHPARESIFSVDGFVSRSGEMVVLGCNMMLQRPRRVGSGIVFDHAPVPPEVLAGLGRLWERTGFFGVFDVEFVVDDDRPLIIDVNPRFYNHMALEIDRGMPLPWLAYLGALGDEDRLADAVRAARGESQERSRVYVHRLPTAFMLGLQRLAGNMSRDECRAWRRWISERAPEITDPATVPGDRMPGLGDLFCQALTLVRHPRSFLGHLARDDCRPPVVAPVPRSVGATRPVRTATARGERSGPEKDPPERVRSAR